MKNETSPTCPICSAKMEEIKQGRIAVINDCPSCGFSTNIDILQAMQEEAIINGEYEEDV